MASKSSHEVERLGRGDHLAQADDALTPIRAPKHRHLLREHLARLLVVGDLRKRHRLERHVSTGSHAGGRHHLAEAILAKGLSERVAPADRGRRLVHTKLRQACG